MQTTRATDSTGLGTSQYGFIRSSAYLDRQIESGMTVVLLASVEVLLVGVLKQLVR